MLKRENGYKSNKVVPLKGLSSKKTVKNLILKKTQHINKTALSTNVYLSLGYKSIAGMSEGVSKLNQDSIYIETTVLQDPNISLLGVMDGHGMQGHRVSGFLRLNIHSKKLIVLIIF